MTRLLQLWISLGLGSDTMYYYIAIHVMCYSGHVKNHNLDEHNLFAIEWTINQ